MILNSDPYILDLVPRSQYLSSILARSSILDSDPIPDLTSPVPILDLQFWSLFSILIFNPDPYPWPCHRSWSFPSISILIMISILNPNPQFLFLSLIIDANHFSWLWCWSWSLSWMLKPTQIRYLSLISHSRSVSSMSILFRILDLDLASHLRSRSRSGSYLDLYPWSRSQFSISMPIIILHFNCNLYP
jgi:hypothetical protein